MIGPDDVSEVLSLVDPGMITLRTAAAVIGGGAFMSALSLAIPSVVDRLMPPPRQDALYDFLPFEEVCADMKTVRCAGQRWFRVVEFAGADITLATDDKRDLLFESRKKLFDELEKLNVDHIKFFHCKEKVDIQRTLHARHPIVRKVADVWEENLPSAYRLRHYCMIVVKAKARDDAMGKLDPAESFVMATMSDYRPTIMTEPDRLKIDPDVERPSGPLKAIAHVISPVSKPDPLGFGWKGDLSALVNGDDVDFTRTERGTIRFVHGDQVRYASIMTWRDCGEKTSEQIMRDVLGIDCEMVVYHSIEPIPQAVAVVDLNRGKSASLTEQLSLNAKAEYDEALRAVEGQVADERAALLYYVMHVMPVCASEKELKTVESRLTAVMTRTAGTVARLKGSAQPTLMSMVSFDQMWPRKFRYLSTNVATSVYPQRSETGMTRSDWADEPLAFFRTVTGDPYPFQFHAHNGRTAPAHTLLIGPTGSGKTSLLTFLASQAMRVSDLRVFLMDRLNGMKNFATCAGGRYLTLNGDESNAGMNPLHMPDTPENRLFLRRWMKLIGEIDDPVVEDEIGRAIDLAYSPGQAMSSRSLIALQNTAFDQMSPMRRSLRQWTSMDSFGSYFNAERDSLDLETTNLVGFNMTDILLDERLSPAVMQYLMHRFKVLSQVSTRPTLMIVDETAPSLRNKQFREFLQVGLQEGRKLRQAYVLCFQTAQSLEETGMSQIILDQCGTLIFFKNLRDSTESIAQYTKLGLNSSEIDFIVGRSFKDRKYAVLIKRPYSNDSSIVDVDLTRLGKYLGVFESDARQVALLEELMKHHPRDEAVRRYIEARR